VIHVNDGTIERVEARTLDVVRFEQLTIDAASADNLLDVAELLKGALRKALAAADGRLLAARITVQGASRAHAELARDPERARAQLQSAANEIQGGDVWLEDVRCNTEAPLNRPVLATRDDAIGQLVRSLDSMQHDDALLDELVAELSDVLRAMPPELRDAEHGLDLSDREQARALLSSAGRMLLPRLLGL
jgi:exonuclease SbcD